jgi:hypothetical protein
MRKVADIIEAIRSASILRGVGDPQVLTALEAVHRDLCTEYHLYRETFEIEMVADQREYALDADVVSVDEALYYTADGVFTTLTGINIDAEFNNSPGWQTEDSGSSTEFYIRNGMLGLRPPPDTTVTDGYPVVRTRCTVYSPLVPSGLTGTATIPAAIPDGDIYIHSVMVKLLEKKKYDADSAEKLALIAEVLAGAKASKAEATRELDRVLEKVNRQYKPAANPRSSWFTPSV